MPRGRNSRRYRTSSQSSVEIQVTKEEAIITTTTNVSTANTSSSNQQPLQVKPKEDFLALLRDVGALGTQTSHGEIFTLKDLGTYLYEYIKERQLWDPFQPTLIHCDKDPLGRVLGVKTFTRADAESLLLKNAPPINVRKRRYPEVTSSDVEKTNEDLLSLAEGNEKADISSTSLEADNTNPHPKRLHMSPHLELTSAPSSSKVVDEINVTVYGRKSPSLREGHSSRKSPLDPKYFESSNKSPSSGSDVSRKRIRQPSFNILYQGSSDGESSYPWYLRVQLPASDSDDEVYSIQSKTTAVVHSSVDDWSGDEELSIEIQSYASDGPYSIDSDSGSSIDITPIDSGPEFVVVCKESDMDGFWADSESSDNESVYSTDLELSVSDKWTCTSCGNLNTPVRSRCDMCWEVRPGWITGPRRYPPYRGRYRRQQQQSRSVPNSPRPTSSSEIASYSDHEVIVPSTSRTFTVKSLAELAQFACNIRNINPAGSANIVPSSEVTAEISTSNSTQKSAEGEAQENLDYVPCEAANQSFTSDDSERTDILNPSDEEELTQRLKAFEKETNDSGVGESFYSSQESIATLSEQSITRRTYLNTKVDQRNSTLDTSSQSVMSLGEKPSRMCALASNEPSGHLKHTTGSLLHQAVEDDYEVGKPTMNHSKSVMLPRKPTAQSALTKSLTLPSTSSSGPSVPSTNDTNLCAICFERPKNACLIHGNTAHQLCCYQCGQILKRNGKLCPVCMKPIQKVVKNFQA